MLILSIDTSTRGSSVALHEEGHLLACYQLNRDRSAAAFLTTLVDQVCRHAGKSLSALDAVAVAMGPGSYTGLRVGVSTAKGLCYALDKPLIGINSLKALAARVTACYPSGLSAAGRSVLFCPMIDARRMEVFCAVYTADLAEVRPAAAVIVDSSTFEDLFVSHDVVFFGDGADKCRELWAENPAALFLGQPVVPSAASVGILAAAAYRQGQFEDLAAFEPFYLKDFVGTRARAGLAPMQPFNPG